MRLISTVVSSFALVACSKGAFTGAADPAASAVKSNSVGESVSRTKTSSDSNATVSSSSSTNSSQSQGGGSASQSCPSLKALAPAVDNEPAEKTQIGTVLWQGSDEPSVRLTPGTDRFETSATDVAQGFQVYGDVLPPATSSGWHLDVRLFQGFSASQSGEGSDHPRNFVAWLGVTDRTTKFRWSEFDVLKNFTVWYWSGNIWFPGSKTGIACPHSILEAGDYRIAMRLELSAPKIYFRKKGELPRGPVPVPSGELRLMMLPQGGHKFPSAQILNSGAVYQGSGGLF